MRRANEPGRGLWSLPGGRVEPGETDAVALAREVHEETGLSVAVGELVGWVTRPAARGVYAIYDYRCQVTSGDLRPGDDASDAAWVSGAIFDTLNRDNMVTERLAQTLAEWDCLPRP
ncbi:NUDIX domain-containing protein [Goodfellowiella coeruleoviolacea]|uniref:NUDIX domain-containing protein n=1 Tax=Goodfellowiella coeruleoviolacea TaxID=334858 RepID=A0AAE3GJP9_9PSEU|nr:NUDIX domain-containing protein [Goodfellowiella coeruleoviolacea]